MVGKELAITHALDTESVCTNSSK